jgi:hypothetical protein
MHTLISIHFQGCATLRQRCFKVVGVAAARHWIHASQVSRGDVPRYKNTRTGNTGVTTSGCLGSISNGVLAYRGLCSSEVKEERSREPPLYLGCLDGRQMVVLAPRYHHQVVGGAIGTQERENRGGKHIVTTSHVEHRDEKVEL